MTTDHIEESRAMVEGDDQDHISQPGKMVVIDDAIALSRTIENSSWLLFNSLQKFGHKEQVDRCLEEMGELLVALLHRRRGLDDDVVSEIADVIIMSEKMKILFGRNAVDAAISQKLDRLAGLMGE